MGNRSTRRRAIVALLFAATTSRLLPHAPNFAAVSAVALFAGMLLGRSWLALLVPLATMMLSDLVLGASLYGANAFQWLVPVYVCCS